MQNAYRSACRRNLYRKWSKSGGERRVTWHGRGGALLIWLLRWHYCGGGRWRCRGSRTVAPSSGAAVSRAEREVPALLFISLANPPLFQTRLLSSLSLSSAFLFVSLCFFSFLCFFPPPVTGVKSSIYRIKGRGGVPIATLSLCMGRGAFLPCHDAEWGGQWVWFAGTASLASHCEGECARGEEINEKHKFLSSLLHVQGKKKEEQCRSKRHRSVLFFLTWNDVVLITTHLIL